MDTIEIDVATGTELVTDLTGQLLAGRPLFGTWQRLVLVDSNVDNPRRRVRFSFLSG